jgi:hypothetical protein
VRQDCAFEFFEISVAAVAGKAGHRGFRASDASCHIPDAHTDEILRAGNDIIDQFLFGFGKMNVFFCKIDISHKKTSSAVILLYHTIKQNITKLNTFTYFVK